MNSMSADGVGKSHLASWLGWHSRWEVLVGCWVWNRSTLCLDIGALFAIFGVGRGSL